MREVIFFDNFEQLKNNFSRCAIHNEELLIQNSPYSIYYLGLLLINQMVKEAHNLYPTVKYGLTVDAGDNGAIVIEALKMGLKKIIFNGHIELGKKLQNIADKFNANVTINQQI